MQRTKKKNEKTKRITEGKNFPKRQKKTKKTVKP